MKSYVFTAIWGVFVWLFATVFFVLFGEHVLFSPGTNAFVFSLLTLLTGTGVLLWGVTHVYLIFDKTDNSALRFGITGTIIGLVLDTFSLSNHSIIFPQLDDSQVISFTAWMSFAYALYLFIPLIINHLKKKQSSN
ncbi:MAG TPA: DUF5367 family protein [Bacillus sp. (in: firmicutes)]|nr:DUF5367 family protein [Bacillus sp. (in: firmicutes)]